MKTLIIYTSSHGCTEKTVRELSPKLSGEITSIELKHYPFPRINEYDRIIIGGSIKTRKIQKRIRDFCTSNMNELRSKEIGLFICSIYEPEIAREEIQNAFSEELHQMAKTEAIFGGEFNLGEMNYMEKLLVRKIAKVSECDSEIDYHSIEQFANRMEETYHPFMFLV
jgi:menaquinone-dependent protoporphyrinogen oxidase